MRVVTIHRDSSSETIKQLHADIKTPRFTNPERTHRLISFDYETFTTGPNVYQEQWMIQREEEYQRNLHLFQVGKRKTSPSKGNAKKKVPFDLPNTMVSCVSLCTNLDTAYVINFGHASSDSLFPVVGSLNDSIDVLRKKQGDWLRNLFSQAQQPIEFIAHNAAYEYAVSMVQGWDFLWQNSARHEGGFICTMLLAKLFPMQSVGLKALTKSIFKYDQIGLEENVLLQHALRPLVLYFGSKAEPEIRRFLKAVSNKKRSITMETISFFCPPDKLNKSSLVFVKNTINHALNEFKGMNRNSLTQIAEYAADDAFWTLKLFLHLAPLAFQTVFDRRYIRSLWDYYRKIEHPVIPLSAEMLIKGIAPNISYIDELGEKCLKRSSKLIFEIKRAAIQDLKRYYPKLFKIKDWSSYSEQINTYVKKRKPTLPDGLDSASILPQFKSPMHLVEELKKLDPTNPTDQRTLIFSILGLPHQTVKKKGPSLDHETVMRLDGISETAKKLIEVRTVKQTRGLYALAFDRLTHPKTQRIHPQFFQSGTTTGRYSASSPNLQQAKKKMLTELDQELPVRQLILADKGCVLLAVDLSQIELRVMAWQARDTEMMKCYVGEEGTFVDIHTRTMRRIFMSRLGSVNEKDLRRAAKVVNFLLQFGGGPLKLLRKFREQGMEEYTLDNCRQFRYEWFELYNGVKQYNAAHAAIAQQNELATTVFGRPRYFPGFASTFDQTQSSLMARQANNHRIQGTAGDILKIIMGRIFWSPYLQDLGVRISLTIHDELVMNVPEQNLLRAFPVIMAAFCQFNFPVPICASAAIGYSFGDLSELEIGADGKLPSWKDTVEWAKSVVPRVDVINCKNISPKHFQFLEGWVDGKIPSNTDRTSL